MLTNFIAYHIMISVNTLNQEMITMNTAREIINSIVPISRFNKGEAGKIFDEVTKEGVKVVIKNNIPTCILINPNDYENVLEELENYKLYVEAEKRLNSSSYKTMSEKDVMSNLGISEDDIDKTEVEID